MNREVDVWNGCRRLICPTRVGMNRLEWVQEISTLVHLPHTRGDEPDDTLLATPVNAHLPHTRGDEPIVLS